VIEKPRTCCDCCVISQYARYATAEAFGLDAEQLTYDFTNDPAYNLAAQIYQAARSYGNVELAALELDEDVEAFLRGRSLREVLAEKDKRTDAAETL
jgi:hypothetical protein